MDILSQVTNIVTDTAALLFRNDIIESIIDKGDVENYATDIDIRIERRLREKLKEVLPEASFIGEESDMKEGLSTYTWIVDPIDGTANFVRGIKECCISVGLVHKNVPEIGVIYAPWLGELYVAKAGDGATLNGKPIHVSDRDFRHAVHYMSAASYNKEVAEKMVGFVGSLCADIEDVRRFGSAALALANIAAGRIETYHVTQICPWDVCAGLCILAEAGGVHMAYNIKDSKWKGMWSGKFDLMAANSNSNFEILHNRFKEYEKEHGYI